LIYDVNLLEGERRLFPGKKDTEKNIPFNFKAVKKEEPAKLDP
jgi:hypothetical protein